MLLTLRALKRWSSIDPLLTLISRNVRFLDKRSKGKLGRVTGENNCNSYGNRVNGPILKTPCDCSVEGGRAPSNSVTEMTLNHRRKRGVTNLVQGLGFRV